MKNGSTDCTAREGLQPKEFDTDGQDGQDAQDEHNTRSAVFILPILYIHVKNLRSRKRNAQLVAATQVLICVICGLNRVICGP
jgi:hypothetical protein